MIKNESEIAPLAALLTKHRATLTPDQSFFVPFFHDCVGVMCSCFKFNSWVPEAGAVTIVRTALTSCLSSSQITSRSILAAIEKEQTKYLQKPQKPYVVLTTLSLKLPASYQTRFDDISLMLTPKHPNGFQQIPEELIEFVPEQNRNQRDFATLRAKVKARCPYSAFERATSNLEFFRGVLNYTVNQGRQFRWSSGVAKPVNEFQLGGVHTVHDSNGKLSDRHQFWYEPIPVDIAATSCSAERWLKLTLNFQRINKFMKRSPYRDQIKTAFVRYAKALDGTNFEASNLKLWSLLEFLTGTHGNYDVTVRRAKFLLKDNDFHKLVLEHLRYRRNAAVHESQFSAEQEGLLFQLKRYVEVLLHFHLRSIGQFDSFAEAMEFLDLPTSVAILKKQVRIRNKAIVVHAT